MKKIFKSSHILETEIRIFEKVKINLTEYDLL